MITEENKGEVFREIGKYLYKMMLKSREIVESKDNNIDEVSMNSILQAMFFSYRGHSRDNKYSFVKMGKSWDHYIERDEVNIILETVRELDKKSNRKLLD